MRWLFILLLLVNLLILGWGVQRAPDVPMDLSAMRPGVGNLRLLSERDQSRPDIPEAVASAPVPAGGVDDSVVRAGSAPVPETETFPAEAAASRPDPAAVPGGEELQVSDEVAEFPLPADVPGIPAGDGKMSPADARRLAAPAAPASPMVCGAFGPFERSAEARALAESLAGQGMDTSLRRESMEKPVGYWVMIPPLPSQEAAIEKVKQLRASGIEDIRRFVKGDQKNGISLGVFSSSKNARSRQQAIAEKGHSASVVPRMISVPGYWVDYRADQERVDGVVARISKNRGTIKNEQYPCSRVVTSGGIF